LGCGRPSARGFHVVAIFNEHDGRDEKAIRPYADIFVHGYPELSLPLIRDFADSPAHGKASCMRWWSTG